MSVQFLTDSEGNQTGVFIPIKDWEALLKANPNAFDDIKDDIPEWHKELVREELRKLERGESSTTPWEEVKADLQKRFAQR